jgi:hypothetical protein
VRTLCRMGTSCSDAAGPSSSLVNALFEKPRVRTSLSRAANKPALALVSQLHHCFFKTYPHAPYIFPAPNLLEQTNMASNATNTPLQPAYASATMGAPVPPGEDWDGTQTRAPCLTGLLHIFEVSAQDSPISCRVYTVNSTTPAQPSVSRGASTDPHLLRRCSHCQSCAPRGLQPRCLLG